LEVVGLIPARGGSKAIFRKNLLPFQGSTLLENTIFIAKASKFIDLVVVNSDDQEMLKKSRDCGVHTFLRNSKIAKDSTTANEVIADFINNFENDYDYYIIYLQPTSPLRNTEHIDLMCEMLDDSNNKGAISVTEIDNKVLKSFFIINGELVPISNKLYVNLNRQNLPKVYISNGAIYLFRKSEFLINNEIPLRHALPFIMESKVSLDIDNIEDYQKLLDLEMP
jgi:N-acylneuraminate cytidylyltransferase